MAPTLLLCSASSDGQQGVFFVIVALRSISTISSLAYGPSFLSEIQRKYFMTPSGSPQVVTPIGLVPAKSDFRRFPLAGQAQTNVCVLTRCSRCTVDESAPSRPTIRCL